MSENMRLKPGAVAPAFSLPNDAGETTSLADYAGERVIVYFYPKANTPGCTKEACDFRDSLAQLNDAGVAVVGISPDPPERLAKFRKDHGLTFPLLSDVDKAVMRSYGAFGEKKNYGKTYMGVVRTTYLIDEKGKIVKAFDKVKAADNPEQMLGELG